ncbi:hypothetical protein P6144_11485 [Sphingomonas sp. HITSZ_GF]|uniref:hypothetical protein n=1 Tax=Sphingomonas sp. HITSZ_GF TaxID=3037247 RepID=UPI00240D57F2|nr:hypothetical protein [Sphingomonas sp. HITSZ_GF]MDG2534274.1 hypothetical protein [Sphingomonas sp. HITSZ_GF]
MSDVVPRWLRPAIALCGGAVASAIAISAVVALMLIWMPPLALALGVLAFIYAIPVTLIHALLAGLPAYLILSRVISLSRVGAAVAGFAIGLLPIGLGIYDAGPGLFPYMLVRFALGGTAGAVGGLAFFCVMQKLASPAEGE